MPMLGRSLLGREYSRFEEMGRRIRADLFVSLEEQNLLRRSWVRGC